MVCKLKRLSEFTPNKNIFCSGNISTAPSKIGKAWQDLVGKNHTCLTQLMTDFFAKILSSAPGPNEMRKESPESTWTCEMLVYLTVSGLSLLDSRKYQLHFAQIVLSLRKVSSLDY